MAATETGRTGQVPSQPEGRPEDAGAPAGPTRRRLSPRRLSARWLGRRWLSRSWARWLITAGAWAAAIALISYMLVSALTNPGHQLLADLRVYRDGGQAILHGRPLYSTVTNGKLLFTYPPVSAVLAVMLAWVPWRVAQVLWMPMIYLPLIGVIWLAFRPLLARAGRYAPAAFGGLLACCALLTPMRQEVHYGQVDIFLVALCAVDCLARRTWWPRGALIGLATAIKLVPGVFIVYLLLTGRRQAAAVATAAFAAWTGLAWLITPANSAFYWTSAIFDSRRLGQNAQADNQSLRGILLRAFFPVPPPTALWIVIALVVAVAGFAAARQAWRRGFAVGGVASTGLLAALLSPVAWVHHYCWIILAVGAIAGDCRSERRVIAAITAGGLFMSVAPIFGGYLYFTHVIPALPALLLEDAFGLAALALIWIMFRIRVTAADRWWQPLAPEEPEPTRDTGRRRTLADRLTS